ncbi:hypothetical protein [Aquabacterium sp.]|uniref:hypothetical protein n=1 Tax=Aquabacterium sp. TaxID=1872578 RepID=UPI003783DB6B
MHKTLRLALNRYTPTPLSLRKDPKVDAPASEVNVDLASLYHHYFLDSFDISPPNPDPAQFEHAQFLLPTKDFRFQGSGLGTAPAIRRHRSNELGQAFCRWFLYENLNITYFAHIEHLIARQLHRPFSGASLDRIANGDTPDYLCATANNSVCLAEAKGRYAAVSFKSKEFAKWREQFSRVEFKDSSGLARSLKGHIVATRFATERDTDRIRSTVFAEDPASPGERDVDPEMARGLARIARDTHFAGIARKLRQPVLASALLNGVPMPDELRVSAIAWRVLTGPLQGERFVGGYYSAEGTGISARQVEGRILYERSDPLRLDQPAYTFFGLHERTMRDVVASARSNLAQPASIEPFRATEFFYSGFSVQRDGTAIAPLEFLVPDEQIVL